VKLIVSSVFGVSCLLLVLLSYPTVATAKSCQYDPNIGKPNPLGMRAYIRLAEADGNTTVTFEQFPSPVGDRITIANRREMIFYGRNVNEARQLLLRNPQYYSELVGYQDPEGFAPANAVLTCR
jgi:hypothetical protein